MVIAGESRVNANKLKFSCQLQIEEQGFTPTAGGNIEYAYRTRTPRFWIPDSCGGVEGTVGVLTCDGDLETFVSQTLG